MQPKPGEVYARVRSFAAERRERLKRETPFSLTAGAGVTATVQAGSSTPDDTGTGGSNGGRFIGDEYDGDLVGSL